MAFFTQSAAPADVFVGVDDSVHPL